MKSFLKKLTSILLKIIASILLFVLAVIFATSISPIYDFTPAKPFCGPDIYNPYKGLDTTHCWKRANFHTHTRVKGIMNECELWPDGVLQAYNSFGYDIVTFSNHNELTHHPTDTTLQVNVYEHGYNLFKFHKLVFGSEKVNHFDHIFPVTASQKQFQIELLSKDSDIIQINHPLRTNTISRSQMEKLSGYELIELDSGKSTENEYWDWALSAGKYSFAMANDDLHFPDKSSKIAVRCNFLCTPSGRYEDLLETFRSGKFYCMRIPDYGNGNWDIKYEENSHLPFIRDIGLKDSTIFISLSEIADSIKVTGQNHKTLTMTRQTESLEYVIKPYDTYARITAYFPKGEVIYSNPFARYDSAISESPFSDAFEDINIILTIIYNILILFLCAGTGYIFYKIIIKK